MRFIMLGDLHYSDYSSPAHAAACDRLFQAFFQQIAALKPDLVFAIGDTTNHGTLTELTGLHQIAHQCDLPFVCVTGNHDINSLEKPELARFFLGPYPSVVADELYTSFDWQDLIHFVVLDTARVKLSDIDWSGFVSLTQLEWLYEEIALFNTSSSPQYLVVLGHHPLYNTTNRSTSTMLYIANSQEVYNSFAQLERKPGLYFCGHNHNHSIAGPDAAGWYFVQSGDPLDCRSFRLVTVTQTQIEIETLDFDLSNPQVQADFETTRTSIEDSFSPQLFETAYGSTRDHELLIAHS